MNIEWKLANGLDLREIDSFGNNFHKNYPEDYEIFVRKFKLFPEGIYILKNEIIFGYAIFHPWSLDSVPPLNEYIPNTPNSPTCMFLHDIVIKEELRNKGYAKKIIKKIEEYKLPITLVAIYDTEIIWKKLGFNNNDYTVSGLDSYGKSSYMIKKIN